MVLYDEAQNFLGLWEKGCWKSDDSGSGKKRNADGTRTVASVKQMGFALQKFMQARLRALWCADDLDRPYRALAHGAT